MTKFYIDCGCEKRHTKTQFRQCPAYQAQKKYKQEQTKRARLDRQKEAYQEKAVAANADRERFERYLRIYSTVGRKSADMGQYAEYCMYYYAKWLIKKFENQPPDAREGRRLAKTVSGAAREMKVSFKIGRRVQFKDRVYGPAGVSSSLVPILSLEHVNFRAPVEERPSLMCGFFFSAPVPETVADLFDKVEDKQQVLDRKAKERAANLRAGLLKMFLQEERALMEATKAPVRPLGMWRPASEVPAPPAPKVLPPVPAFDAPAPVPAALACVSPVILQAIAQKGEEKKKEIEENLALIKQDEARALEQAWVGLLRQVYLEIGRGMTHTTPVISLAASLKRGNDWLGHFSTKESVASGIYALADFLPTAFKVADKGGVEYIRRVGPFLPPLPLLEEQLKAALEQNRA